METKPLLKSKVLWFNIFMTVLLSAPVIATAYKAMEPNQAVFVDSILGLITGLGNVVLRVWFTEMPIDTPQGRAKVRDFLARNCQ